MQLVPFHGHLWHQVERTDHSQQSPDPRTDPDERATDCPDPSMVLVPLESQDENPSTDSQDSPKEGFEGRSVPSSQVGAQNTPDEGTHQAPWQSQNDQPADRPNQTADEQSEDKTEHSSKSEPVHRAEKEPVPAQC